MKKRTSGDIFIDTIMVLAALLFFSPFYICAIMALKTPQETAVSTIALPKALDLNNFVVAMERTNFLVSFLNSVLVTVFAATGIVLLSAMCGYVICRNMHKRFYRIMNQTIFIGIMIPFQVIMIPIYRMYKNLALLNTFPGIIILMIGTSVPYATFLITGFVKTVPIELEEAARIDGYGVFRTFWQIVFPLLKPIISTVGILHVLWMWNEFTMSFIILQKEAIRTLPIQQYHFFGQFSINLNLGFASACLSMIPVILFFIFTQRLIISGITSGAVKG